ncbi:nuclear transport factor 2 family protein [Haliea salexigens]|jgi:hypothetical protein|uniref:nuclear transport factor 2 family protein n=1 Tax=Haliea salexigens TaxID=287487 RepID=UPI000426B436|nr:nuclear transport factor 2 family protein [Haliea salexigens]|tara:strand:+ start:33492 stop:33914 length:423 start_codon:yes stop_codon:yes gene_type:complete
MSTSKNRALIAQYFDVILGHDTSRELADFFTADVTWQVPGSNPHITPNPRVGHAAVMDLLHSGVGVYEAGSMTLDLQPLIVADAHVVAQFTLHARLANGDPYTNTYCFVFALRAGRICAVTEYLDTLAQAQQGTWDALTT